MAQELKAIDDLYERRIRNGSDPYKIKLVDVRHPPVYLKSEVDAVLAEKDKEIERLDDLAHAHNIELLRKENLIAEKDAEIRRLQRALWLARADSAKNAECRYHRLAQKEVCDPQPHGWSCYINGEVYPTGIMSRKLEPHYWCDIWDEVERKCRAKAEAYK